MPLIFLLMLLLCSTLSAQKTVYLPAEWRNFNASDTLLYAETDVQNRYTWSKSRSLESDNVIVFWDKGYGSTPPHRLSSGSDYYVDIEDLLSKAEAFYHLECSTLGFVDVATSNLSKYKVMILLNHSTEWICYGGGYDFQVPALWLSPSTCHPVGHSVAHEVGHSFHYMCYAEDSNHGALPNIQTGFHGAVGNGSVTWEQTAQWQANQSYPELMFDQSMGVFRNSHNLAFTHEWHRYQSYWFFYYLCQHYDDLQTIAQVWNHRETAVKDFNQVFMDLKSLSVDDLYRLYFDYALRCVTWDFDVCSSHRESYIGDFSYSCVRVATNRYQVAYSSAPQSTGFNVIELSVPSAGTVVTTSFTALSPGSALATNDPARYLNEASQWASSGRSKYNPAVSSSARGFRVGYVALLRDGTRRYFNDGMRHCTGTGQATEDISMTVPANTLRLWLVVSPAPSSYVQHLWDESYANDDQWPYQFTLTGTDYKGSYIMGSEPGDTGETDIETVFHYDIRLPISSSYLPVLQPIREAEMSALGYTAGTELISTIVGWNAEGPAQGQAMFYAVSPDGTLLSSGSTANGYGHWFRSDGALTNWGADSHFYSEFAPQNEGGEFSIGNMPSGVAVGDTATVRQAWVVNTGTRRLTVHFLFHITVVPRGDVNRDGQVTIADVTALVNIILGKDNAVPYQYDHNAADVNEDHTITIADVTALVNVILGKANTDGLQEQ